MRTPFTLATRFAAFAVAAAVTPAAAIDTINCARDRNPAERTICASHHLQILDAKVTEAYADIIRDTRISGPIRTALRDSQFAFLARRDACGRDTDCLAEAMQLRAIRINDYR